jgi:hypothetical protein
MSRVFCLVSIVIVLAAIAGCQSETTLHTAFSDWQAQQGLNPKDDVYFQDVQEGDIPALLSAGIIKHDIVAAEKNIPRHNVLWRKVKPIAMELAETGQAPKDVRVWMNTSHAVMLNGSDMAVLSLSIRPPKSGSGVTIHLWERFMKSPSGYRRRGMPPPPASASQ